MKKVLDGILFEGKPVEVFLEAEKAHEARAEYNQTLSSMKRIIRAPLTWVKQKPGKKVAKRTRHLSDEEIRKEYGLSMKPYQKSIQNMFWVLKEHGPCTGAKAAEITGMSPNDSSTLLSRLFKKMNPLDILERQQAPDGKMEYRLTEKGLALSVEELYATQHTPVGRIPSEKTKLPTEPPVEKEITEERPHLLSVLTNGHIIPPNIKIDINIVVTFRWGWRDNAS